MVRRAIVLVLAAALGVPVAIDPASAWVSRVHRDVDTTVFWVGEKAGPDNGYISNAASAWQDDWQSHFGGVDDPRHRNGYHPAAFTPKENPFYFALPYFDYDLNGRLKKTLTRAPWYDPAHPAQPGESLLKNSWIKVTYQGRTVYGQWEDVGPFLEDDVDYVFGGARPRHRVGLDLSPAMADHLGLDGSGRTSWQFVRPDQVPDGPWKQIVTTSGVDWR